MVLIHEDGWIIKALENLHNRTDCLFPQPWCFTNVKRDVESMSSWSQLQVTDFKFGKTMLNPREILAVRDIQGSFKK